MGRGRDRSPRHLCLLLLLQLPRLSTEISHISPKNKNTWKRNWETCANFLTKSKYKSNNVVKTPSDQPTCPALQLTVLPLFLPILLHRPALPIIPWWACRVRRWLFDVHTLSARLSRTATFTPTPTLTPTGRGRRCLCFHLPVSTSPPLPLPLLAVVVISHNSDRCDSALTALGRGREVGAQFSEVTRRL